MRACAVVAACSALAALTAGCGGSGKRTYPPTVDASWVQGIAVVVTQSGGSVTVSTSGIGAEAEHWLLSRFPRVVTRARLQAALDELNLSQSALMDPATAARAGRLIGANALLLLDVADVSITFDNIYHYVAGIRMSVQLVEVETGQVRWAETYSKNAYAERNYSEGINWGDSASEAANAVATAGVAKLMGKLCGYTLTQAPGPGLAEQGSVMVAELGVQLRQGYGGGDETGTVRVTSVRQASWGARTGFKAGDSIVAVNDRRATSLAEVVALVSEGREPKTMRIELIRDGSHRTLEFKTTTLAKALSQPVASAGRR